jgi:PBSX family phage terminase large subunit
MATNKRDQARPFKWGTLSRKAKQALTWWVDSSPHRHKDIFIADGAVRSSKSLCVSSAFVDWAMERFSGELFGMAGKTIGSFRQNVLRDLKRVMVGRGYTFKDRRSENVLEVSKGRRVNEFEIFGGKDEASQDLIQGRTLAGFLGDEAALYPQSFLKQAMARCSVDGSKIWLTCNPGPPQHPIKKELIDRAKELNLLHIHFTLDDNLTLTESIKNRYKALYSGLFFKRFILGLWVMADGIIYDMFDPDRHIVDDVDLTGWNQLISGVDYGIGNPTTWDETWTDGERFHVAREYYHSSGVTGRQMTDDEYADEFDAFWGERRPDKVYIDPSAASLKLALQNRGYSIFSADNDVLEGIKYVSTLLHTGKLTFSPSCHNLIEEMGSYIWDANAQKRGEDKPLKAMDHCFAAGTMVETINGEVPIEEIVEGDLVLTSQGFKNVLSSGITSKNAEVFDFLMPNDTVLIATKGHPVYTECNGFVEISNLKKGDVLKCLCKQKHRSLTESCIDVIQNQKQCQIGGILGVIQTILKRAYDICIETFGSFITEKYRMDTISTTSMGTFQITPSKTYGLSMPLSTYQNTERKGGKIGSKKGLNVSKKSGRLPLSGIAAKKVKNGILNMPKKFLAIFRIDGRRVRFAGKNTKQRDRICQDFAPITANQNSGECQALTTLQGNVKDVGKSLLLTNTARRSFVQAVVQKNIIGENKRTATVYNLTVDNCPEFFANGVLVHNCQDRTRYALFSHSGKWARTPLSYAGADQGQTATTRKDGKQRPTRRMRGLR